MQYNLKDFNHNGVKFSEDKKSISIDYTVNIEAVDDNIKDEAQKSLTVPISRGITVTLPIPENLVTDAETKVTEWFNNNFKKTIANENQ